MNGFPYVLSPFPVAGLGWLPPFPLLSYELWARTSTRYHVEVQNGGYLPCFSSWQPDSPLQLVGRNLLLCSGLLAGPGRSPSDESAWGMLLSYGKILGQAPGTLRLDRAVDRWDTRKKGLLAECLAIGLAGYHAWTREEVVHIADANHFIGKALASPTTPRSYLKLKSRFLFGANGGYKPDFFGLTQHGEAVVIEVKGAIGPPARVMGPMQKGKQQVSNVDPVGVRERRMRSRLVYGINLRHDGNNPRPNKDTTLQVCDPEGDDEAIRVPLSEKSLIEQAYKKLLLFCRRSDLVFALEIMDGAVLDVEWLSRHLVEPPVPFLPLYADPIIIIGLYGKTAEAIFCTYRDNLVPAVTESLRDLWMESSVSHDEDENYLVLPNGMVAVRRGLISKHR